MARTILDRSQRKEKYSSADFTAHAGIPTYIDSYHAIAYTKVVIIDKAVVTTGSFNFAKAAEGSNAQDLFVIYSKTRRKSTSRIGRVTRGMQRAMGGGSCC